MNFLSGVRQTVLFRSNCATYWQLQEKIVPNCQNDTSFSSSNHTTRKGGKFQNCTKPCSCMIRSQSPFSFVPSLGSFNCSEYGKNLRWICYGKQMFLFMAQLHLFRISLNLSQKTTNFFNPVVLMYQMSLSAGITHLWGRVLEIVALFQFKCINNQNAWNPDECVFVLVLKGFDECGQCAAVITRLPLSSLILSVFNLI